MLLDGFWGCLGRARDFPGALEIIEKLLVFIVSKSWMFLGAPGVPGGPWEVSGGSWGYLQEYIGDSGNLAQGV